MNSSSDRSSRDDSVRHRVVAIDGPAGSGKSTVAKRLANVAGLEYLDTGAMYRAVTFAVILRNVDPEDSVAVTQVAEDCTIVQHEDGTVTVDGVDATVEIRGSLVSSVVSLVSSHEGVRRELVSRQRQWVRTRGGGVLDGRDIATAVFPDALLKVYLTASPEIRATRRTSQGSSEAQTGNSDTNDDYDRVLLDIQRRDKLDSEREHDPLRQDADAYLVDTSDMTIDEVVAHLSNLFDEALRSISD